MRAVGLVWVDQGWAVWRGCVNVRPERCWLAGLDWTGQASERDKRRKRCAALCCADVSRIDRDLHVGLAWLESRMSR